MRQPPVELPPGAYPPGGPSAASVSCTPSASDQPGSVPPERWCEVGAFYWTVLTPDIVNLGREEQGSVSV